MRTDQASNQCKRSKAAEPVKPVPTYLKPTRASAARAAALASMGFNERHTSGSSFVHGFRKGASADLGNGQKDQQHKSSEQGEDPVTAGQGNEAGLLKNMAADTVTQDGNWQPFKKKPASETKLRNTDLHPAETVNDMSDAYSTATELRSPVILAGKATLYVTDRRRAYTPGSGTEHSEVPADMLLHPASVPTAHDLASASANEQLEANSPVPTTPTIDCSLDNTSVTYSPGSTSHSQSRCSNKGRSGRQSARRASPSSVGTTTPSSKPHNQPSPGTTAPDPLASPQSLVSYSASNAGSAVSQQSEFVFSSLPNCQLSADSASPQLNASEARSQPAKLFSYSPMATPDVVNVLFPAGVPASPTFSPSAVETTAKDIVSRLFPHGIPATPGMDRSVPAQDEPASGHKESVVSFVDKTEQQQCAQHPASATPPSVFSGHTLQQLNKGVNQNSPVLDISKDTAEVEQQLAAEPEATVQCPAAYFPLQNTCNAMPTQPALPNEVPRGSDNSRIDSTLVTEGNLTPAGDGASNNTTPAGPAVATAQCLPDLTPDMLSNINPRTAWSEVAQWIAPSPDGSSNNSICGDDDNDIDHDHHLPGPCPMPSAEDSFTILQRVPAGTASSDAPQQELRSSIRCWLAPSPAVSMDFDNLVQHGVLYNEGVSNEGVYNEGAQPAARTTSDEGHAAHGLEARLAAILADTDEVVPGLQAEVSLGTFVAAEDEMTDTVAVQQTVSEDAVKVAAAATPQTAAEGMLLVDRVLSPPAQSAMMHNTQQPHTHAVTPPQANSSSVACQAATTPGSTGSRASRMAPWSKFVPSSSATKGSVTQSVIQSVTRSPAALDDVYPVQHTPLPSPAPEAWYTPIHMDTSKVDLSDGHATAATPDQQFYTPADLSTIEKSPQLVLDDVKSPGRQPNHKAFSHLNSCML